MKSSAGFKPAPVPAPTSASYQAFQAKPFFANGNWKCKTWVLHFQNVVLIFHW